jgi:hypothetical protein
MNQSYLCRELELYSMAIMVNGGLRVFGQRGLRKGYGGIEVTVTEKFWVDIITLKGSPAFLIWWLNPSTDKWVQDIDYGPQTGKVEVKL